MAGHEEVVQVGPTMCVIMLDTHPLGRFYIHSPPLEFDSLEFLSLEQAFGYVVYCQAGREQDAGSLHDTYVRQRADQVRNHMEKDKLDLWPELIYNQWEIYHDLMIHQVEKPDSSLRTEFDRLLNHPRVKEAPEKVEFVQIGKDPVMATMDRYKDFIKHGFFQGQNLYGKLVRDVFVEFSRRRFVRKWHFSTLRSVKVFGTWSFSQLALICGDSQLAHFVSATCSTIFAIGGAKYDHLVNALEMYGVRLSDFRFIVINVGFNLADRSERYWRDNFRRLKKMLIEEDERRNSDNSILISPGFNLPKSPRVEDNSRWIAKELEGTRIRVVDWTTVNNPFVSRGEIVDYNFENDRFHINEPGTRLLWGIWCQYIDGLRKIRYNTSGRRIALPRNRFDYPPKERRSLRSDLKYIATEVTASRKRKLEADGAGSSRMA